MTDSEYRTAHYVTGEDRTRLLFFDFLLLVFLILVFGFSLLDGVDSFLHKITCYFLVSYRQRSVSEERKGVSRLNIAQIAQKKYTML